MISGLAAVAVVVVALPLLVGGVFVVLIVANRADPDPSGRRPMVVYTASVSFLTLFLTLFATYLLVVRLCSLIGPHPGMYAPLNSSSFGFSSGGPLPAQLGPQHPVGDAAARGAVLGLLIALVAGATYLLHLRATERATAGVGLAEPAGRVRSSYTAAVCFLATLIAVVSAIAALYQFFRILGPGVFTPGGTGSRLVALRGMLPLLYLAAASIALLVWHVRQLPPGARPALAWLRPAPASPPASPPAPDDPGAPRVPATSGEADVTAVEVEVLDVAPPPRKRAPRRPPRS